MRTKIKYKKGKKHVRRVREESLAGAEVLNIVGKWGKAGVNSPLGD